MAVTLGRSPGRCGPASSPFGHVRRGAAREVVVEQPRFGRRPPPQAEIRGPAPPRSRAARATVTTSPMPMPLAGFSARLPFTRTKPSEASRAARERVRAKRANHSHLSSRCRSSRIRGGGQRFPPSPASSCALSAASLAKGESGSGARSRRGGRWSGRGPAWRCSAPRWSSRPFRPTALEALAPGAAIPTGTRGAVAALGAAMLRPATFGTPLSGLLALAGMLPLLAAVAAPAGPAAGAVLRTLMGRALMTLQAPDLDLGESRRSARPPGSRPRHRPPRQPRPAPRRPPPGLPAPRTRAPRIPALPIPAPRTPAPRTPAPQARTLPRRGSPQSRGSRPMPRPAGPIQGLPRRRDLPPPAPRKSPRKAPRAAPRRSYRPRAPGSGTRQAPPPHRPQRLRPPARLLRPRRIPLLRPVRSRRFRSPRRRARPRPPARRQPPRRTPRRRPVRQPAPWPLPG